MDVTTIHRSHVFSSRNACGENIFDMPHFKRTSTCLQITPANPCKASVDVLDTIWQNTITLMAQRTATVHQSNGNNMLHNLVGMISDICNGNACCTTRE